MKLKKFRRSIVIGVCGFLFACVLCVGILFFWGERHFSHEKWIRCDPAKRYLYIENFEEQYNVIGMNRYEIEDLLGPPEWTITEQNKVVYYEYNIRDDFMVGWKVYQISFQDDIVVGTRVTVGDW